VQAKPAAIRWVGGTVPMGKTAGFVGVARMLATGLKYELDALANKDFRYLNKTYLPRKLKEEDWLD
jgi:DNA topoisomerase-6 subunit A